jgi:DNA-binding transcriptional MerR regulator
MGNNVQDIIEEPFYNIGAVSEMTNIPASTLRAWERRYDFPQPVRTDGGHRLYSERDIERLKWIKDQTEHGMQISQAVQALRRLEEAGQFPKRAIAQTGSRNLSPIAPAMKRDQYRQSLMQALLGSEAKRADSILSELLALYPVETLLQSVIVPLLNDVGEGWLAGEISVSEEHFTSQFLRRHLIQWLQIGPPPFDVAPVVLACAPGEWHELSLLIFGVMVRRLRWPVVNLGQSVPLDDLAAFIKESEPLAVVIAAMTEPTARELVHLSDHMPEVQKKERPLIAYGGRFFVHHPEWITDVPGLYLGDTYEEGVSRLDRRLRELTD